MGSGLLSPTHLAVVLAIVLIVFGPKRLPELGRALGSGMRSFKDALDGADHSDEPSVIAPPAAETPPATAEPLAYEQAAPPAGHAAPAAHDDAAPPASGDPSRQPAGPSHNS